MGEEMKPGLALVSVSYTPSPGKYLLGPFGPGSSFFSASLAKDPGGPSPTFWAAVNSLHCAER